MEATWTGGTIISTIVITITALVCIAAIMIGIFLMEEDGGILVLPAVLILVTAVTLYVVSMWPFTEEHHKWHPMSGEIATIDKRLLSDGSGGMSEAFPITLKGDDEVYRVDDTRAATWDVGDRVNIKCKRVYSFSGYDGWECIIGDGR